MPIKRTYHEYVNGPIFAQLNENKSVYAWYIDGHEPGERHYQYSTDLHKIRLAIDELDDIDRAAKNGN